MNAPDKPEPLKLPSDCFGSMLYGSALLLSIAQFLLHLGHQFPRRTQLALDLQAQI